MNGASSASAIHGFRQYSVESSFINQKIANHTRSEQALSLPALKDGVSRARLMTSPLQVFPGDAHKLLSTSHRVLILSDSQLMALSIRLEEVILEYQRLNKGLGVYTNRHNTNPTYHSATCVFFSQADTYYESPLELDAVEALTSPLVVVDTLATTVHTIPYTPGAWQVEPHPLSIVTELAAQVIQQHFNDIRPWMHGIIPVSRGLPVDDTTTDTILDTLIYNPVTALNAILDEYPSRLLKVSRIPHGLAVNILCDVRVYLWTKHMENTDVSIYH